MDVKFRFYIYRSSSTLDHYKPLMSAKEDKSRFGLLKFRALKKIDKDSI
jgi:hypothetical protein